MASAVVEAASPEAHAISVGESQGDIQPASSLTEGEEKPKSYLYGYEVTLKSSEKEAKERAYQSTLTSYEESEDEWQSQKERIDGILGALSEYGVPISKKDWNFMKGLCRRGIPFLMRPRAWVAISGATIQKSIAPQGYELLKKRTSSLEEKVKRQIEGDINRTFPCHPIFQTNEGTECLKNVLSVFALTNPQTGYAQGLNFVAGMLIIVLGREAEEDVFWTLTCVVNKRMYPETYGEDLKGCHIAQKILNRLVEKKFPKVFKHFQQLNCELSFVTSEWLLCLFSRSYPTETVARVWDSLLFEGFKIFYRVSLAFLKLHQEGILGCDNIGDLITFVKDEVKAAVNNEQIMRRAFHGIGSMRSKEIIKYAIQYEQEVDNMLEMYSEKRKSRAKKPKISEAEAASVIQRHYREYKHNTK